MLPLSLLFRKLSDVGNGGRRLNFDFLPLPLSLSGAAFNKVSIISFNSVSVSVRNLFSQESFPSGISSGFFWGSS